MNDTLREDENGFVSELPERIDDSGYPPEVALICLKCGAGYLKEAIKARALPTCQNCGNLYARYRQ